MAAKVGGIMIWELGQDRQPFREHADSLMGAVHRALLEAKAAAAAAVNGSISSSSDGSSSDGSSSDGSSSDGNSISDEEL